MSEYLCHRFKVRSFSCEKPVSGICLIQQPFLARDIFEFRVCSLYPAQYPWCECRVLVVCLKQYFPISGPGAEIIPSEFIYAFDRSGKRVDYNIRLFEALAEIFLSPDLESVFRECGGNGFSL